MAVIAIAGTSGVGKSFLARQLAALECAPVFLEGEEGVLPEEVLTTVFSKEDPVGRFRFFVARYEKALKQARAISDARIDCFVDGAPITAEAVLADEDPAIHDALRAVTDPLKHLAPDTTIILTASVEELRTRIAGRARAAEPVEAALERSLRVQDELVRLAKGTSGAVVVDRTGMEFTRYEDLMRVLRLLGR